MKRIACWGLIGWLVVSSAGMVLAQAAAPAGGTLAGDAKALRSYAPTTNPGQTNFNATDRAAIANQIYAYAFAYDNGDADAWFGLFTPDAVFVAGIPGETPVAFTGTGFRSFWTERLNAFRSSGNVRRHLMSNILFLDQTAETAHVSVVGLLTNAKDGKTFSDVTSLNYEGWLVKGPEGWKIQRWHDFPDSVVPR